MPVHPPRPAYWLDATHSASATISFFGWHEQFFSTMGEKTGVGLACLSLPLAVERARDRTVAHSSRRVQQPASRRGSGVDTDDGGRWRIAEGGVDGSIEEVEPWHEAGSSQANAGRPRRAPECLARRSCPAVPGSRIPHVVVNARVGSEQPE
jgi:hypothetical protein